MKHIFILNPVSGNGQAVKLIPLIEALFKDQPDAYEIYVTERTGHATELTARFHAEDDVTVYACGGDGTNNEVLNGLNPGVPMAMIPCGTGNDFMRMLNLPEKLSQKDLLRQTVDGKVIAIDCGVASGKRFLNCSTMGFDADVGALVAKRDRSRYMPTKLVYLVALFKILTKRKPAPMIIDFNGMTLRQEALVVAVMNGRFYGGGFMPTPEADIQDGLFDLCVIEDTSLPEILRLLPKYMKGTHIHESIVRFFKSDAIHIRCPEGANIQTDGEITRSTDLDIHLLKGQIRLRVPQTSPLKEATT